MTIDPREGRMRLTILGGFLGAGKSTWLRHHLHHGLLRDAFVMVNEAADAPVDDTLLIGSTRLRVLAGGCACCEMRPALVALLREICDDRVGGGASASRTDRIVLETSGLADPGRIVDAIATDPVLQHHVVVGEIIVTVDALYGLAQLREEDLGRRQIETADRLVVTKVDAAEPERLRRLIATLRVLNPGAALSGSVMGSPTGLPDASGADPENLPVAGAGTAAPIGAASLDLGETLDWPALTVWLSALIHARGDDILRIKGVVRTPRGRLLLQSVRKVVQSPEILPAETPTGDTWDGSLVLIGRHFTADALVRSLNAFGIGGAVAIEAGAASGNVRRPTPPAGIVSKSAVLRVPPQPIDVSSMTPEALPDAWSGDKATAHSIEQALAYQRNVSSLPWKLVETAITAAMNSGFLRQIPGTVSWPCQPHEAAAIEFGVPEATGGQGGTGGTKPPGLSEGTPATPWTKTRFREAVLDSSEMTELVESMGDVLAAAGNLTLRFRVSVEFADGETATPEVAAKLSMALAKAAKPFE